MQIHVKHNTGLNQALAQIKGVKIISCLNTERHHYVGYKPGFDF